MAREAKRKSHATPSPPLTPDQVFRLDNVVKKKALPKELQSLKSSNSFTIVDARSDLRLEKLIHKVSLTSGMSAWHLDNKLKVIHGLPVQNFIRQKRAGGQVESPTLPLPPPEPPSYPEWADRIYHPKISPR